MSNDIEQCILKWNQTIGSKTYWYVIRKSKDNSFSIEGYLDEKTGRTAKPEFRLPFSENEVEEEFKKQGKIFNKQPLGKP